jgi:hypothetical protein
MIPFVKEIVPMVDVANRRIEILPPAGLLEIYLPSYSAVKTAAGDAKSAYAD